MTRGGKKSKKYWRKNTYTWRQEDNQTLNMSLKSDVLTQISVFHEYCDTDFGRDGKGKRMHVNRLDADINQQKNL